MTKEEALKKWKEEVKDWRKAANFNPTEEMNYSVMADFVEILDAVIDPKEPTCTQNPDSVSMSQEHVHENDGWKPWPPLRSEVQGDQCIVKFGPSGSIEWWRNAKAD